MGHTSKSQTCPMKKLVSSGDFTV
ncbi:MAG: hypothetical protein E2578_11600 [Comamonas sp.]|nr:hypothetical protein [Comamonas sp.]